MVEITKKAWKRRLTFRGAGPRRRPSETGTAPPRKSVSLTSSALIETVRGSFAIASTSFSKFLHFLPRLLRSLSSTTATTAGAALGPQAARSSLPFPPHLHFLHIRAHKYSQPTPRVRHVASLSFPSFFHLSNSEPENFSHIHFRPVIRTTYLHRGRNEV